MYKSCKSEPQNSGWRSAGCMTVSRSVIGPYSCFCLYRNSRHIRLSKLSLQAVTQLTLSDRALPRSELLVRRSGGVSAG